MSKEASDLLSLPTRGSWEGEASPFGVDDPRITHHVIDRPHASEGGDATRRERVQPQWVYDAINARTLLPTYAYRPGVKCPAHLSPFVEATKGEEPKERVRLAVLAATRAADEEGDEDLDDAEGDDDDEEGDAVDEDEDEEDSEAEDDDDDADATDEAVRYRKELAAEVAGVSYAQSSATAMAKRRRQSAGSGDSNVSEDKALAMMMMSRKKRRLYDRMQYGIQKKAEAEQKLQDKRDAIDAAATKGKKQKAKKTSS